MIFKHISMKNFCNLNSFESDLYFKTQIDGKNKEGKSTIRNGILWVLTDKLADNSAAGDSVRPHDENGNRIDSVDISVSLTVSIDDSDYILTKTQRQKWVKKRGSEEQEFQGNENLYEISGVPKKAKDFEQFINENICPVDEINFCLNANAFLSLDSKKRRAKVLSLAQKFTDDDVINANPQFEELRADLKIGTVDELMKRAKSTLSALKKNAEEIPARIDELNGQIADYDFSALELEKNTLNEKIADIDKQLERETEIKSKIMQAKFDLSSIEQNLNSAAKDAKHEKEVQLSELKANLRKIVDDIERFTSEKEKTSVIIANNVKAIEEAENQKRICGDKVFDDAKLVCPTCHQPYPKEQEEVLRRDFEQNRQKEIERLVEYITELNNRKKSEEVSISEIEKRLAECIGAKEAFSKDIDAAESEIAGIAIADVTKDSSYIAKMDEIATLENELKAQSADTSKTEIECELADVERKLAQAEANNRIHDRIASLRNEQKIIGENTLKQERILYLLEEFNVAKIAMLEDSVNKYFSIIKFSFFKHLINGGWQEVCELMVDGTSYETLLNKSDRLLSQMDLCNGFMKAAGVNMPILCDDMESIDNDRVPSYDHQMILFRRADCKLSVKSIG